MSEIRNDKEVYFYKYCPECKYKSTPETDDPCNECLIHGSNVNSHKPVMFEQKK